MNTEVLFINNSLNIFFVQFHISSEVGLNILVTPKICYPKRFIYAVFKMLEFCIDFLNNLF